jgi:hypothetical protein
VGRIDGAGVDEDREVDRDRSRAVDPLLADDDTGIGGGRLVHDRHDRDGLWRQGGRLLVGQRPTDGRVRGSDRDGQRGAD